MKRFNTLHVMMVLCLLGLLAPQAMWAQQGQQAEPNVRIRVEKTEGGSLNVDENDVRIEENTQIESILRQYGLDKELGELNPGEEIEIIVRRRKGNETVKEFSMEIDPLIESLIDNPDIPFFMEKEASGKPLLGVRYNIARIQTGNRAGETGAEIISVVPGSGAEAAGLAVGDIILSIDGVPVLVTETLYDYVGKKKPGDQVTLKYYHEGEVRQTTATLGERQDGPSFGMNDFFIKEKHIERKIHKPSTDPDKTFLGVTIDGPAHNGVRISNVLMNSTAKALGLEGGDIINSINQQKVETVDDLLKIIQEVPVGDEITIVYNREGDTKTVRGIAKSKAETQMNGRFLEDVDPNSNAAPKAFFFKSNEDGEEIEFLAPPGDDEAAMKKLWFNTEENDDWTTETRIVITMHALTGQEAQSMTEKTGQDFQSGKLEVNSLDLFPNPNGGRFNLAFQLAEQGDATVKIFDSNGVVVYSELLRNFTGNYENEIDLSGFARGAYFLYIGQGEKTFSRKIITQ